MGVELNILNAMLASIGSSSIVTATGNNPNLQKAKPILERKNLTVQARGHWFNTEYALPLAPNGDGEFVVPQSTLRAQPSTHSAAYVRRGTRMYDPKNHTYALDEDMLELDIVIELPYDDLPQTAIDLIESMAILEMVTNFDADSLAIKSRQTAWMTANRALERERLSLKNVSLRDNPHFSRFMQGVNYHSAHPRAAYIGG